MASFYHHFDVVRKLRDGATSLHPPRLTVRVCDGLAPSWPGAQSLLARLPEILAADVRVIAAPCVGRCEQAPVAVVGQRPVAAATPDAVAECVAANETRPLPEPYVDHAQYVAQGGYRTLRECVDGARDVERPADDGALRFARTRWCRVPPPGAKWRIVRSEPAPR